MKITVMGAGAWGTALAIHFARHGHDVTMWARNAQHVQDLAQARENARYLPGFAFPDALQMQADLGAALQGSELVLMVTSVAGLRDSAQRLIEHNAGHLPVLTACKGFEQDSGLLTFQVVKDVLPDNPCIGVLSGPSFAQELARQLPCAVVPRQHTDRALQRIISGGIPGRQQSGKALLAQFCLGKCGTKRTLGIVNRGVAAGWCHQRDKPGEQPPGWFLRLRDF